MGLIIIGAIVGAISKGFPGLVVGAFIGYAISTADDKILLRITRQRGQKPCPLLAAVERASLIEQNETGSHMLENLLGLLLLTLGDLLTTPLR